MENWKRLLHRCLGWFPPYQIILGGYRYYRYTEERTAKPSRFRYFGRNARLSENILVVAPERCHIGDCASIGPGCTINAVGGFHLGRNSIMGPECLVLTTEHRFKQATELPYDGVREVRPVFVGDYVWIGARAIVRSGVQIGDGAVVGMGSVVTRDVPPLAIVAGNPARTIGERASENFEKLRSRRCGRDPLEHCSVLWVPSAMQGKYPRLLKELGFDVVPGEEYFIYDKAKPTLARARQRDVPGIDGREHRDGRPHHQFDSPHKTE